MKNHLHYWLTFSFLFTSSFIFGQISSYPYAEDFESPSIHQQTPQSCDLTTPGAVYGSWTQDPNDDGDWRADTAGTPSTGTGPGSGRVSSGVGIGTDVNPGTTSGTYIYTEGSFPTGANACSGSNISILSPYFDFSASGKFYQLKFHYHMLGTTMGNLFIDVRTGNGSWTNSVWSQIGEKDSAWVLDSVNLANYSSDSIQIRIRAVMGNSWSSDIAIDNFVIDTFSPTLTEAILLSTEFVDFEYPIIPLLQHDSISFRATVRNEGLQEITQTEVDISSGTFSSSIDLDTISSFTNKTGTSNDKYLATSTGDKVVAFEVSIFETDNLITNNYDTLQFIVSDTVMARENETATINSIGAAGVTIEMGQKFSIGTADTITSATFYLVNPTPGDSARIVLRNFGTTPGSVIETSDPFVLSAGANWYTVPLNCFTYVGAGDYFLAIEQLGLNNLTAGTTTENYTPLSAFYNIPGNPWVAFENNANPFLVSLLLRMNFGHPNTDREVNILANKDTVCANSQIPLTADAGSTFVWAPANKTINSTDKTALFRLDQTTDVSVIADFGCGLIAYDTLTIYTDDPPSGGITSDTTICLGDSISLSAYGGDGYRWNGGPNNAPWTVSPTANSTYQVIIDSSNGCFSVFSTQVDVSEISITVSGDTAACTNELIQIYASGASTYAWDNGPSDSTFSFNVSTTEYKYVTGTNIFGCTDRDSVLISEYTAPILSPMADTGACFGSNITLTAVAVADSFLWSNGDYTQSTTFQMLVPITLSVIARNNNGCETFDTLFVERHLRPNGSIDPDTAICEGQILKINAYGGATYEWDNGDSTQEISVSPTLETKYDVVISSPEGCQDIESITVSVNPLPIAAFSYKEFKDSLVFVNESSLATSYSWDFGDGQSSILENPYNVYKDSGDYSITLTATNDCGDVDSTITVNVKVPKVINDIEDLALWNNISLYPNPATSKLFYKLDNQLYGALSISIINVNGKTLYTESTNKGSNKNEGILDLSNYSSGIYYIEFKINESIVRRRVVKH